MNHRFFFWGGNVFSRHSLLESRELHIFFFTFLHSFILDGWQTVFGWNEQDFFSCICFSSFTTLKHSSPFPFTHTFFSFGFFIIFFLILQSIIRRQPLMLFLSAILQGLFWLSIAFTLHTGLDSSTSSTTICILQSCLGLHILFLAGRISSTSWQLVSSITILLELRW